MTRVQTARTTGKMDEVVKRELEGIADDADQAADLCRQLRTCVRDAQSPRQKVQLNELLGSSQKIRKPLRSGIKLDFELVDNLPLLCADARQLEQAISNLVRNACEAIDHPQGRITIRTAVTAAKGVSLSVTDNGCGISSANLKHIFKRFFSTKSANQNRGLGLAVVKGVARTHGGSVDVHSVPGQGTTVTLHLPLDADSRNPKPTKRPLRGPRRQ
jgi:signal transduction histidine kinase